MGSEEALEDVARHAVARRRRVPGEMMEWIDEARRLVADHFPAEHNERHNELVMQTAMTLMLSHRLGEMETALDGMRLALESHREN